jgi:hypothetical protein
LCRSHERPCAVSKCSAHELFPDVSLPVYPRNSVLGSRSVLMKGAGTSIKQSWVSHNHILLSSIPLRPPPEKGSKGVRLCMLKEPRLAWFSSLMTNPVRLTILFLSGFPVTAVNRAACLVLYQPSGLGPAFRASNLYRSPFQQIRSSVRGFSACSLYGMRG